MNDRSASKIKELFKKINQKIKHSISNPATPLRTKRTLIKKSPNKKPPVFKKKSPLKNHEFESTSLNQDSLRQLQSFSNNNNEAVLKVKQKLKASKQLLKKSQEDLLKAYERIAELEDLLKKAKINSSHESTKNLYK